jgi:hypothetical protein
MPFEGALGDYLQSLPPNKKELRLKFFLSCYDRDDPASDSIIWESIKNAEALIAQKLSQKSSKKLVSKALGRVVFALKEYTYVIDALGRQLSLRP